MRREGLKINDKSGKREGRDWNMCSAGRRSLAEVGSGVCASKGEVRRGWSKVMHIIDAELRQSETRGSASARKVNENRGTSDCRFKLSAQHCGLIPDFGALDEQRRYAWHVEIRLLANTRFMLGGAQQAADTCLCRLITMFHSSTGLWSNLNYRPPTCAPWHASYAIAGVTERQTKTTRNSSRTAITQAPLGSCERARASNTLDVGRAKLLPEDAGERLDNEEQHTTARGETEHLGRETLVQRADSLLARDAEERGVGPACERAFI